MEDLKTACAERKAERKALVQKRRELKKEQETLRKEKAIFKKLQDEAEHALWLVGAKDPASGRKHKPKITESIRQRMRREGLTQERLRALIHYDPPSGEMFRTAHVNGKIYNPPRQILPTPRTDGYQSLYIDGVRSYIHRFIFFYMEGRWPATIVHSNTNKTDNRWENIQEISQATTRQAEKKYGFHKNHGLTEEELDLL